MIKEWIPDVTDTYKHWKPKNEILNGNACMHIVGRTDMDLFVGLIQLNPEYNENNKNIYETIEHNNFSDCVKDISTWWKELIEDEALEIWNR